MGGSSRQHHPAFFTMDRFQTANESKVIACLRAELLAQAAKRQSTESQSEIT
jgi:hypothetical protein